MESEVAFYSEGERVAGTLCLPDRIRDKAPAVALLHGYSSFRDDLRGFVELAALLADHGIASLRFDFRGCGSSGEPGRFHPHDEWIEDARAALSYLEGRPEVDAGRLGLAGISVGGGVTVGAAALDPRVRCAVALCPVADGGWWLEHLWTGLGGRPAWEKFLDRLAADRRRRAREGASAKVPMEEILAFGPEGLAAWRKMREEFPRFASGAYLSSPDSLLSFQPRHLVHRIAPRPLRIIHSLADASVPFHHAAELYGRAGEIKDLVVIRDSPHCFWTGDDNRRVQELTLEWLERYL